VAARIWKPPAKKHPADTNAYRLIYSEGDLLPSLIVDRYADVLVLQTLSQGTDALSRCSRDTDRGVQTTRVIERNDARVRELEGLPLIAATVYGEAPPELEILQHGLRFLVSRSGGQKTGSFLDQRENRLAARAAAHDKQTSRSIASPSTARSRCISRRCESVIGIDISGDAVAAAQRNATLNDLTNVEFREANVFDALRELEAQASALT
jgi:23S rRNA (cytosine1962-C5)-methyltransferase